MIVASLTESETETRVEFVGGEVAALAGTPSDQQLALPYLSLSLRHHYPVGVLFGEGGRLAQVGSVTRNQVCEIYQHPRHAHLVSVRFGGEPAPKHLWKEHPKFADLMRQLTASAATEQLVWCTIQGGSIVDVKTLAPDEDDALCQWIQQTTQGVNT
jgi:hypothetical protein